MNKFATRALAVLATFPICLPNLHAASHSLAQQAYVKPAAFGATQAGDGFGQAIAVSGDTMVIGAPFEDSSTTGVNSLPNENAANSGAAYVFVRSAGGWTQQAYLKPGAVGITQAGDHFGASVAISGDILVIGAPLEDSNTTGVNSTANDTGPIELGLYYLSSGAAYIFVRSGTNWTQQAYLKPGAVGTTQQYDTFGSSVAVSGETVIVGAPNESSNTSGVNSTPNESPGGSGAAYVFVRSRTNWTQQAYLKPASFGRRQGVDLFGSSVGVSGDTVVIGAPGEDSDTTGVNSTPHEARFSNTGAAYVFTRNGTNWAKQAYLKPANVGTTNTDDAFGASVAVSGDTVVVGAPYEASGTTGVNSTPDEFEQSGAAYVFARSGSNWAQQAYLKPAAVGIVQVDDLFGSSVAVSGDTVVIGAPMEDSNTTGVNSTPNDSGDFFLGSYNLNSGAAFVFVRTAGAWTQQEYLKPAAVGTSQADDRFGSSVAVSGDTVVVGAANESSSTTGVNSPANESAQHSGAAYVFVPDIEAPVFTSCPMDLVLIVSPLSNSVAAVYNAAARDNSGTNGLVIACVPPSGSGFPVGTNHVLCTATDAAGNHAECGFQVVVLGARGLKHDVLAELIALRAAVTDKKDRRRLDQAIEHLTKSLDPDLWLDQTHLDSKHGERAFLEEKKTVEYLLDALKRNRTTLSAVVVLNLIERIVRADRLLAAVALAGAAGAGDPNLIRDARRVFFKGETEAADANPDKAIEHYAHAWHDAIQSTITRLVRAPDGPAQLKFLGEPLQKYAVQCSTDLKTWTTLDTRTADTNGMIEYEDADAGKLPARFYRIATP